MDGKTNEQLLHYSSSQVAGNGRISPRTILESPESVTKAGDAVSEFRSGIEGTEWDNHLVASETLNFVNNNDTFRPNTQHEIVNNRMEHLNTGAHLMYVNSDGKPENEESF